MNTGQSQIAVDSIPAAKIGTVRAWQQAKYRPEPEGPWRSEPTKVQWVDAASGLPCLIVRNRLGSLCGYAGVPHTHPDYGLHYDSVDVQVHGGLTYADVCQHTGDEATGVCHIPEPGATDDVWWLGFDCAHHMDLVPGMISHGLLGPERSDVYRDLAYVADQVKRLAAQLAFRGDTDGSV